MQKLFLDSNSGVFSINKEGKLITSLPNKTRLLPPDNLTRIVSLNEQYNKERDECRNFRLIVNVNPICSNVLFNVKSEIVINEGQDTAQVLMDLPDSGWNRPARAQNTTEIVTYYDAIRNTEYSHKELGGYIYHCGFDIFNNHMLRNDDFVHVNKINSDNIEERKLFNTIGDYARYVDGNQILQDISYTTGSTVLTKLHLYQYDTMLKMKQAFLERCEEKDGWWGFYNPSYIDASNGYSRGDESDDVRINQMLSSNKPCEFIDLYPDRSLFSFVPKFNKYRKRIEKNWDYCITYPYENDYKIIDVLCGGSANDNNGSIRLNYRRTVNSKGADVLVCQTYLRHTLERGDTIVLFYKDEVNNTFVQLNRSIKVETVGDAYGNDIKRTFTIRLLDILDLVDKIDENIPLFYKKQNNGSNCLYYARKFKKIGNLNSDINKVAFGRNIYGDDISQIIFTDDINIDELKDNNDKPVSEVYLTVVKRNKGWREWAESGICSSTTTEYSHCFGKVTSGIDFVGLRIPVEVEFDVYGDGDIDESAQVDLEIIEPIDFNIHRINNVHSNIIKKINMVSGNDEISDFTNIANLTDDTADDPYLNTLQAWGVGLYYQPKSLENYEKEEFNDAEKLDEGITINDDIFWGDIVEFDPSTYTETVIEPIYHRFNTTQRECLELRYKNVFQDVIASDDYDNFMVGNASPEANVRSNMDYEESAFRIKKYYLNDIYDNTREADNPFGFDGDIINGKEVDKRFFGNIMPEGYYYRPHTKIQLLALDDEPNKSVANIINYASAGTSYDMAVPTEFTFKAPTNFGFYKGDNIAFYNIYTQNTIWSEIVKVQDNTIITVRFTEELNEANIRDALGMTNNISGRKYFAFWSPDNVPTYAKLSFGERRFVWKKFLKQSELMMDNSLYNTPFSNGRLYIEKNINFFLRRQDPNGTYGLSKAIYRQNQVVLNPMDNFIIRGYEPFDFSINDIANNNFDNCY